MEAIEIPTLEVFITNNDAQFIITFKRYFLNVQR